MTSLNGLQSGIDNKITYVDINGNQDFQLIKSFQAVQDAPILKTISMDGTVRNPQVYQGWNGTFIYDRNGGTLDDYINSSEANYYLGGDQKMATITQTITNPDGSVTQYQFENVAIQLTDAGTYSGTEIVTQTATFMASRRLTLL